MRFRWDIELWPTNPMRDGIRWRRPESIPLCFWRSVHWLRFVAVAAFLILLAVPFSNLAFGLLPSIQYLLFVPPVLVIILCVWPRIVRKRFVAALEEHDYLLCMICGYPLLHVTDKRICSECGTPYDPFWLRTAWRYWVRHRRLPLPRSQRPRPYKPRVQSSQLGHPFQEGHPMSSRWNFFVLPNPMGNRFYLRRPEWIPRYYWREAGWIRYMELGFLVSCTFILIPCMIMLGVGTIPSPFFKFLLFGVPSLYVLIPHLLSHKVFKRFVVTLREHDYLLCMTCGYRLLRVTDRRICPECGEPYDPDRLRKDWRYWARYRRLPVPRSQRPRPYVPLVHFSQLGRPVRDDDDRRTPD